MVFETTPPNESLKAKAPIKEKLLPEANFEIV